MSATGTLAVLNDTVSLAVDGRNTATVQLTGTWTGTAAFYGSPDGLTTLSRS